MFNIKMIVMKRTVFLIVILLFLFACSKPLDPKEVFKIWNDALYEGNIELATKHTSITATEYLLNEFSGLNGLSKLYQAGADNRAESIIEEQKIDENTARVIYRFYYEDGTIKRWEDTLFYEEGIWKVAPQYVRAIQK